MLHALKTIQRSMESCLQLGFFQYFPYHRGPPFGNERSIALAVQLTIPNVGISSILEQHRLLSQDSPWKCAVPAKFYPVHQSPRASQRKPWSAFRTHRPTSIVPRIINLGCYATFCRHHMQPIKKLIWKKARTTGQIRLSMKSCFVKTFPH